MGSRIRSRPCKKKKEKKFSRKVNNSNLSLLRFISKFFRSCVYKKYPLCLPVLLVIPTSLILRISTCSTSSFKEYYFPVLIDLTCLDGLWTVSFAFFQSMVLLTETLKSCVSIFVLGFKRSVIYSVCFLILRLIVVKRVIIVNFFLIMEILGLPLNKGKFLRCGSIW